MTFLVTGATGNVGRQVVAELLRGGESVRTYAEWAAEHGDAFRR
ncbi:hypothetical protein [Streptomyces sp. A5-4]